MPTLTTPSPRAEVPLTTAAHRIGRSYVQTQRLVLIGTLLGRQIAGRWFVDEQSLDVYAASQDAPAAA